MVPGKYTPKFDVGFAAAFAEEHFGIRGSVRELPSERDQNFLLTDESGEKFVLKIANERELPEFVDAQNAVLKHLGRRVSFCQRLVTAVSGVEIVSLEGSGGATHLVRMVHFVPGVPLGEIKQQTSDLLRDVGKKLGEIDRELADFDHPAVHRDFHWDLANGNRVIDEYSSLIKDANLRDLVLKCRMHFEDFRRSVIHGDANDYNVIVDPDRMEVVALIDFGDMVYSYTAGNLAIAIAYVVLDKDDPFASAQCVIDGYTREFPLLANELERLWDFVRLRLAVSVCMAAYQELQEPDNEYLRISQRAIRETLPKLAADLRR